MSMTLLDMVQDIASEMGSFRVNNINDNAESRRIVQIIKQTFYKIHTYRYWPMDERLITLDPLVINGSTVPNALVIPWEVEQLKEVYYNKRRVRQLTNAEMLKKMMMLNHDSDSVEDYLLDGVEVYSLNDKTPSYFSVYTTGTSTDKKNIMLFDSYDKELSQSLLPSKAMVLGVAPPEFVEDGSYVPEMPERAFPYLLAEAKAKCFVSIKQAENPAATADSKKLRSWLAVEGDLGLMEDTYPNYGRK